MKLIPQLLLAASLTMSFATLNAKSVSAAIINYAFNVDSPTAKGNGFFSFDDATLSDNNSIAIAKSLSFQFDGDSTVYTEQDDINYPDFPLVYATLFSAGQTSLALDYTFDDKNNPANPLRYEIIGEDFTIFSPTDANVELISGKVSYTRVPEPATLAGTLLVCSLGLMTKKKLISIKKVKA
ncbi:PEP-CTERM exosortase interaction domain-containing protein [Nostoc linckia z18]|uniref:PEP-CTERM exosortase interaction domain-containing protein n=2 Tax=Nostoc linckia TaxID=92942 RepID=A0A9Q5Z5Y3_NOSLI|nr:PEP-CTERM sorting domain-containing protein [Nostoc linckia]PHK32865.1 PEP-CTERM exosortase interaction domain-containing protein [Nostoc linckia z15]PHK41633.1 PEP-CTERM exosortase interaction domain-containing protein [Nostoc linckia z16]PHJ56359.1 PEP-CTERM exosortase interaction domain-containing protein [Nostoc linckia z1]PHJ61128.1 PEP-CTERM exosortase interaction domain-containing protein [Nostoc linckia z2]PHJ65565.1 PEP-CTERM exosortase interaction domain-containing protein [Nostoc